MLRLYASLISCLLALGCSSEHSIQVEGAWVGKILPTQSVTAGYMRITNTGHIDDRLVSVSTVAFEPVEMHEMALDDKGVMRMRKSGPIDLKKDEPVELKRGGYHLMLIGPQYAIAAGNDIPLALTFESARELIVAARVRDE